MNTVHSANSMAYSYKHPEYEARGALAFGSMHGSKGTSSALSLAYHGKTEKSELSIALAMSHFHASHEPSTQESVPEITEPRPPRFNRSAHFYLNRWT